MGSINIGNLISTKHHNLVSIYCITTKNCIYHSDLNVIEICIFQVSTSPEKEETLKVLITANNSYRRKIIEMLFLLKRGTEINV